MRRTARGTGAPGRRRRGNSDRRAVWLAWLWRAPGACAFAVLAVGLVLGAELAARARATEQPGWGLLVCVAILAVGQGVAVVLACRPPRGAAAWRPPAPYDVVGDAERILAHAQGHHRHLVGPSSGYVELTAVEARRDIGLPREGAAQRPPAPYDVLADAEEVLARAQDRSVPTSSQAAGADGPVLDPLRASIMTFAGRAWRQVGRGIVVLDLRAPSEQSGLVYLPESSLREGCGGSPGRWAALLWAVTAYRPPDEALVVVSSQERVRAYRLTGRAAGAKANGNGFTLFLDTAWP